MRALLRAPTAAQRLCADCNEEVQRASTSPAGPGGDVSSTVAAGTASGGAPLPGALRHYFEPRFGHDLGRVRLHTDTGASSSARALNARAYTFGHDIAFGAGEFASDTIAGRRLLAHELAHVVQQGTAQALEQRGGDARVQRKPAVKDDCPARDRGEAKASASSPYRLVERSPQQEWLIYDFRVGSSTVDPAMGDIAGLVEKIVNSLVKGHFIYVTGQDPVEVLGYADCQGDTHEKLREERAANFCAAYKASWLESGYSEEAFNKFIRSCRAAPVGQYVASNDTQEGRSQNRGVLIRVLPPSAKAPGSSLPYDDKYGPTDANCATYKATKQFLNGAYANNSYCACTHTPDEPHNNCVRSCLQSKLWSFLASNAEDLRSGRFIWCPTIWRHHKECYQECGCDNGFIELIGFYPVCEVALPCVVNGLGIAAFNRCMEPGGKGK